MSIGPLEVIVSLQHMVGDGWVPEDILADYAQA